MKHPFAIGAAAALMVAGAAALAAPAQAHTGSDTQTYIGHCDAFILLCVHPTNDPTGGDLCPSGTCWTGGYSWDGGQVTGIHDYDDDGLDVRATITDDVGNPDWGSICVNENADNVCNEGPQPDVEEEFCGRSDWIVEQADPDDEVVVFVGGQAAQAWSNRPDAPDPFWDKGIQCDPTAAGATTGTVTLDVRE